MKVLKILGIVVLVIIALILVLSFTAPDSYEVERSVTIDSPKELVFGHVKYWRNWAGWSPWKERDPKMEVTVKGTDGEKGSSYNWVGDPEITGAGSMTNTGVKENQEILFHLMFKEPWESESDGWVRVADEGQGKTKVSWGFAGDLTFPFNIMTIFMSMESMIAPDFERGLALLKEKAEKEAKLVKSFKVKELEFPGKRYAIVKGTVSFDEMQQFYGQSYGIIKQAMKKKWAKTKGAPVGFYYSWDEQNKKTELAAGMPTNRKVETGDVQTLKIEPSKALVIEYMGGYSSLPFAHKALGYHLQKTNRELKLPIIEEYVTDPMAEPDSSKWLTKIYYLTQ
jgi:effector-binding domain-containing protein